MLTKRPEVKFLGVCHPAKNCEVSRYEGAGSLILLSAMDPLQMRALALARSRKLALLYHGSRFKDSVLASGTANAVADEIVNSFTSTPTTAGAL